MYRIEKYALQIKSIIYYLYDWEDIVYIWESWVWIKRCFQHTDKNYTHIEYKEASDDPLIRKRNENELIIKYKPKYNKKIFNVEQWYVNLNNIKDVLILEFNQEI